MAEKYDPKKIEGKWREVWEKTGIYDTEEKSDKPKFYALDMFPYPSGVGLHVGHPKGYIATDVFSRMKTLQGYNVLHPMGWDAFGLPAENYALKNKVHPKKAVDENVKKFKKQLEVLGFNYDWGREINTTDPAYYKWTQWIFLKLFEKGLAYESDEPIIWCPGCKTGLAQEDLEGAVCERCGSEVEKKPMRQWVLKMTDYADRLLYDLDNKDLDWEEQIKEQQRNWIGRSEGTLIKFKIKNEKLKIKENYIEVFTTRVDTIFGCTYLVLAPEHPFVASLLKIKNKKSKIKNYEEVEKYIKSTEKKSELDRQEAKEKTGVFTGSYAINPFDGKEIPVWVADYVLYGYGTGAVMAVPAHDERDWEFAKKYDLPIKQVIAPSLIDESNPPKKGKKDTYRHMALAIIYDPKTNKYLVLKWKKQPWTSFITGGVEGKEDKLEAIKREIVEETGYTDVQLIRSLGVYEAFFFAAHKNVNRKVLGEHFLFELKSNEKKSVAKEEQDIHEIAWLSPEDIEKTKIQHVEFTMDWERIKTGRDVFTGRGVLIESGDFDGLTSEEVKQKMADWLEKKKIGSRKVNYKLRDWVFSRQRYWGEPIPIIHCEKCGVVPVPEKELPVVLPEVEKYEPTGTGESPLAAISEWVNAKCPICGGNAKRETNTMPQWAGSCWYYLRYIDPKNDKAIVSKDKEKDWMPVDLYVGGAEHATRHLLYARFWHKFLYDIKVVSTSEPFKKLVHVGLILAEDGRKMSKRWNNVINPDDIVNQFGADSMRIYEMFMGPFTKEISWSTQGVKGVKRFLDKVWSLSQEVIENTQTEKTSFDSAQDKSENMDSGKSIEETAVTRTVHKTIKKVTEDIEDFKFNTAVSAMMECVNELMRIKEKLTVQKSSNAWRNTIENLAIILSPFAPHMAEEIWEGLGLKESIFNSSWPTYDKKLIKDDTVVIPIQINGKVRDEILIDMDSSEEDVKKQALESEKVRVYTEGKDIKKTVYIKGRLLSIVVE